MQRNLIEKLMFEVMNKDQCNNENDEESIDFDHQVTSLIIEFQVWRTLREVIGI